MKQTSSALTFLLAQYRAIFKRAYIKGLATAVLLTAGLAAGQAQAKDLTISWESGDALETSTAEDTFRKDNVTVGGITINAGDKLTTSGGITVSGNMTASGDLTIEEGALLLANKENVGTNKDQTIYRYKFTSNGGDIIMTGNIGAASFSISGGTLELNSGGAGDTNLTAYGSGWKQGDTDGSQSAADYDRGTADGRLSNMKITVNKDTNVSALNLLTIENSEVFLSGSGDNLAVNSPSGDLSSYLQGSKQIKISETTITVSGNNNAIVSANGQINDSTIEVNSGATLLITGAHSHGLAQYSLSNTDIINQGELILGETSESGSDSFTITGGTIKNTGTVDFEGGVLNLDSSLVAGIFASGDADAKGKLNLVNGAKVTVTGDDLADLSAVGIADASGSGSNLVASVPSTWTQDNVKLGTIFNSANLAFDVKNLTAETAPYTATSSGDNAFVIEQGTITVSDSFELVNGTGALTTEGVQHRIYVYSKNSGETATLNLKNDGRITGQLKNVDRLYVGYGSTSGDAALTVDGNWDFGGARLAVNTNGEANLNGTITKVSVLSLNEEGVINIGSSADVTIGRLLGSEPDVTNAALNIDGKLTITGDGTTETQNEKGEYANDVQLTKATVNINNGGTLAITGEDAVEDIFKVNTSGDTITSIEVVTSGGKSGDFGGWDKSKVNLKAGGTLKIDLADVDPAFTSIDSGALNKLKGELVGDPSKGSFDFGNINIDLSEDVSGAIIGSSIGYDTLVSGGVNNVQGIDALEGLTVAVDTSKNTSINLSMGASSVALTGSDKVNVDGSLILANNSADGDHSFVYQAATTEGGEAKIASVTVAKDSGVNLTGAGTIGSLTKSGNVTGTSAVLNAGEGATQTVAGKIDLETVTIGTGTVTVADDIKATNLTLTGDLVNTAESGANTLEAAKLTQAQGTTLTADELTLGATDSGTASTVQGTIVADTIAINKATTGSNTLTIAGGSTVTSNTFEAASGAQVYVGLDGDNSSAGSLSVTTMDLNGADLIVDPEFGTKSSFVGVKGFYDRKNTYEAGMLDGNAYALKNAILSIGDENETNVRALFADYLDADNSLNANGVGAIVYVAKNMGVADTHKIVVDPAAKLDANGKLDTTEYTADLTIRNGGALAIDVTAAAKNDGTAALNFAQKGAEIEAGTSAKILLTGDYTQYDTLTLFKDGDGDGLTFTQDSAQSITVETLNGLLQGTYSGTGGSFNIDSMTLQTERVKTAYTDTSSAVRNSIISYVARDTDWANQDDPEHDIIASRIHGARADGVEYDFSTDKYYKLDANGDRGDEIIDQKTLDGLTFVKVKNPDYDKTVQGSQEYVYLAYEKAANAFLDAVAHDTLSGNAADSAAHMAEFGGVAQVALKAGSTTTDAIAGRMGMGAQNSAITFANNGQGAGIWVTPIYVSSDSDGFEAQGVDYGTDINLYGVALGGDYTLANGVRIGAMFNVGSGDADGQGAGSSVTSDFDYYGFGLYAGYSVGQFSIVGDVSYTAVDNDVEANTNIDKLETSLDSSNLSVGVTGSYAFETAAGVTVTPHVGLRYSNIDIDDYSVKGKTYGTVGDYSADSLSVFSIPVGVTIASEFQAGTWSVKPSFDVTLTGNFGDDEAEGTFHWAGVENIDSSLNSEIFDNFTYGASLGIAAQSSSGISLGVAVGYTGSSNVDDFGVNANARFTF